MEEDRPDKKPTRNCHIWEGPDEFATTAQYKQHRCNTIEMLNKWSLSTTHENQETGLVQT